MSIKTIVSIRSNIFPDQLFYPFSIETSKQNFITEARTTLGLLVDSPSGSGTGGM